MPSHGNFPLFENVGIRIKQIYFEFTFTEALLKMPSHGNFLLFDRENMGIQLFMLSLSFPEALFPFLSPVIL